MVDLDFVTEDVRAYFDANAIHAGAAQRETVAEFLRRGADAMRPSALARQVFLFSTLQCGAIAFVAWIWRVMLGWAPGEFLNFASVQDVAVAFAVAVWTYLCAALAASPIALFT